MVRADDGLRGGLALRGARLSWGSRTYVMGIVNVTPDSFSGDGIENPVRAARFAQAQWEQGADLLDIGGESTRPGHSAVDETIEIERVEIGRASCRERV